MSATRGAPARPVAWPVAWSLALLAGVAQTFSFAPFELWWLQIAALAVLAGLVADVRAARAAALGWLFGVGWLTSGL